jgi:hypothetical protein
VPDDTPSVLRRLIELGVLTSVASFELYEFFVTVALAMGEPLDVPGDTDDAGIEAARRSLETRLHALEERARILIAPR